VLLDLIRERPVHDVGEADMFVPHLGGVVANVAVVAARAGARVALAGCAGDDPWGLQLRRWLAEEGVDLSRFRLVGGRQTALALVAVDDSGEPTYHVYGDASAGFVDSGVDAEAMLEDVGALFLTSNTLVNEEDATATMRLRELALERGLPVIVDPNVRLHRWRSRAAAAAAANACVHGALLVRCNAAEAELLTGEADIERAALALVKAGARLVVVSLGADGAILRGDLRLDVAAAPVSVVSTMGAGDVLTGWLVARLALSGFYPPAVAAGLPEAVARAAAACERWGAIA
jgi:fructokinase